jgi:hypothetical protein
MRCLAPLAALIMVLAGCGSGTDAEGPVAVEGDSPYPGFTSKELTIGAVVEGTPSMVGTGEVIFGPSTDADAVRLLFYKDAPELESVVYAEVTGTFPSSDEGWCMYCVESVKFAPDTAIPVSRFQMADGMWLVPGGLPRAEFDAYVVEKLAEQAEGGTFVLNYAQPGAMEMPNGTIAGQLDWNGEVLVVAFAPLEEDQILLSGPEGARLSNQGAGLVLEEGSVFLLTGNSEE